ncbi:MAG: chemotaxis protein CheA, partial [Alicyclobacillus sp.]|nr:chemotaxis protein CheA [Alicyclobacillus sp.]
VHDLAGALGKRVQLRIEGADTWLDRSIADGAREPILHLLRNALDHGLETPEERRAAGKPELGTITLAAGESDGCLWIEVADDGRGIRRDRIVERALELGMASPEEVRSWTDDDVAECLFRFGFSTAARPSDISGRGVGLDSVREKVRSLGGRVSVASAPPGGTSFRMEFHRLRGDGSNTTSSCAR